MFPRRLLLTVAALAILLTATSIRGPFTIDESNYLVTVIGLRNGSLTVPGTAGLPPSRELLWFDPGALRRDVASTPVASTAPPLYAPLGVTFSLVGWRGLVALNVLAFAATILIVFAHARRYAVTAEAPWIAAIAVGAASYLTEYAQGMWPHLVTVALVAGAAYATARALEEGVWTWAAGAGFLAAWAAGIRYQNAFVLGCLGLGILLLARRRVRPALAFAAGAAAPLAATAALNFARIGSLNPISKGANYLPSIAKVTAGPPEKSVLEKIFALAWGRVVDYSVMPTTPGTVSWLAPHPESGAYVLVTAVKKAWLQSAPWIAVALAILILAWLPVSRFARVAGGAPQRQLRLLSLVVIATLAMFAASGSNRTDGFCFNQRYFCELLPLAALAFAWSVEGIGRHRTALLLGTLGGCLLGFAALAPDFTSPLRHRMILYAPLLAAVALLAVYAVALHAARGRPAGSVSPSLAAAAGAAMAWAMLIHLGDDLPASRRVRGMRRDVADRVRPMLEDGSAVFATGVDRDALGPLVLERDLVLVNPTLDAAATAGEVLDGLLAQDRRVFLLPNALPIERLDLILVGKRVRYLGEPPVLIEVRGGES